MKYLSILVALMLTFSTLSAQMNVQDQLLEVSFNASLDFDDLTKIKRELSKKNIQLDYEKLEFREDGKLFKIVFKVDCNDGFKGSAQAELTGKNSYTGFYRNYDKTASSVFGTGGSGLGDWTKWLGW